jgi:hypothetical protein
MVYPIGTPRPQAAGGPIAPFGPAGLDAGAPAAVPGAMPPLSMPRDGAFNPIKVPDRVFVFHGVDVSGMADHGRGATDALAGRLRAEGFPEAHALHYNSNSWLLNQLAVLRERLFGTFSKRMAAQILADLQQRPLQPGQRISLMGYSLGSLVAARVAEKLQAAGVPVGTLVLIEPKNGGAPSALYEVPRAQKVVLVENQPEFQMSNPNGVPFAVEHVPSRTHLDMIERPDEGMLRNIVAHLRI